MSSTETLLSLIYGAHAGYRSLRSTIVCRHDPVLGDLARRRWAQAQRGVGEAGSSQAQPRTTPAGTEVMSWTWLVWRQQTWKWRVEKLTPDGRPEVSIVDGGRSLVWDGRSASLFGDESSAATLVGLDRALVLSLDPAPILSALLFETDGQAACAGRVGLRAVGRPRSVSNDVLWPGADRYDLLVDQPAGILLRAAAVLDGVEYASHEVTEIVFDEQLPDDMFALLPPG